MGDLVLPGNIQAVTEAPILARAEGYVQRRYVDIGDRVTAGQLLAEVEAPDLDQQVRQAQAAVEQAQADLERANAALEQGKANESIAKVTATRWDNLVKRGAVSKQENDQYQAQYQAQAANVRALERAVDAAKGNIAAMQANVGRLTEMQGYLKVRAPFAGVITLRNVDVGTLVNTGNTMLFRIAQTNLLRTYLNVPQSSASDVHVGQMASLATPELPERKFSGAVTRTANALDPSSRTLLVEVQVPNPDGKLLPGMYVEVDLHLPRKDPPLLLPSDTLVVRPEGTMVAAAGFQQRGSLPARRGRPRLWEPDRDPLRAERRTARDRESERFRPGRREGSSGHGTAGDGRRHPNARASSCPALALPYSERTRGAIGIARRVLGTVSIMKKIQHEKDQRRISLFALARAGGLSRPNCSTG